MANSLKSKLAKLRHDRNISEKMYNELLDKLDGHDRELRNKAIDEFADKIMEYCSMSDMNRKMITQIAEQIKGG